VVTREEIVREALVSLTGAGSSGLVLREVARRLHVSLSTIQRHFATKDDLWRACVDAVIEDVPIRADSSFAADPQFRVSDYLKSVIERTALYPHTTAAMWSDTDPGAEERLAYLAERMTPVVEIARSRFAVATELGLFRDVDADVFFALISLGISSLGRSRIPLQQVFGIDLEDSDERTRFANSLADILLNGVLPRSAPD
jgi:AcrR family transcriptional regulator